MCEAVLSSTMLSFLNLCVKPWSCARSIPSFIHSVGGLHFFGQLTCKCNGALIGPFRTEHLPHCREHFYNKRREGKKKALVVIVTVVLWSVIRREMGELEVHIFDVVSYRGVLQHVHRVFMWSVFKGQMFNVMEFLFQPFSHGLTFSLRFTFLSTVEMLSSENSSSEFHR